MVVFLSFRNLSIFSFSERQQVIFSFLIDAINDEGYLTETYESLINSMSQEPKIEIHELEILKDTIGDILMDTPQGLACLTITVAVFFFKENKISSEAKISL